MRREVTRAAFAVAFAAALAGSAAAQPYDPGPPGPPEYGYGGPPPSRGVGVNCAAMQPGLFGPQPYSCPLRRPRPLASRCFCELPVTPFGGPGGEVWGRVVP